VAYENNDKKMESVYSARIRAGKRRTYFFDVRATRGNDYYLTITESRKRFNEDGYDRHKLFLYKEDFNKFIKGLTEAVEYVKTDLMPDFDFDAFNHDNQEINNNNEHAELPVSESATPAESVTTPLSVTAEVTENLQGTLKPDPITKNTDHEEVDKW
jgi:hypothetical protein